MIGLPILILSSILFLVRADPGERERRAPGISVPSVYGKKSIDGATIPFGTWEHSTQCVHIDFLQSNITLPWGEKEHLPSGSTITIDVVARKGSPSTFPRDSDSFYLWADGKMIQASQGSGTCGPDLKYSTCLDSKKVAKLVSVSIPSTTKTIAILPVSGKCQQTAFRIKTKIPGKCGTDEFHIPLDIASDNPIHTDVNGALPTCSSVNSNLVHASWRNLRDIADIGFDCLGPNAKFFVASWNEDKFDESAIQISHGDDREDTPSVEKADSSAHPPICSGSRQTIYGQQLVSNIRIVHIPQGFLREQAPSICQANGYTIADLVSTTAEGLVEIKDALTELYLADGELGIGWIRSFDKDQFWNKCVGYALDPKAMIESNDGDVAGHIIQEPCDSAKLSAVICMKPDNIKLSEILRQAQMNT